LTQAFSQNDPRPAAPDSDEREVVRPLAGEEALSGRGASAPLARPFLAARGEWKLWWALMVMIGALFSLLWNPHWVPGGDSDFYTAVARNIVLHHGFTYNGIGVGIAPPVWPYVLAGAMKISAAYGFLKLLPMAFMTGFLGVGYWILRRYTCPRRSAIVVLSCALVTHLYCLTFWLHSDALFCLLGAGAVLVAMQINEGRSSVWRIALLGALCVASVGVRWVGVLNWMLVAGALLRGYALRQSAAARRQGAAPGPWAFARDDRRLIRLWTALLLSGVLSAGTFFGLRAAFRLNEADKAAQGEITDESRPYDLLPREHGRSRRHKTRDYLGQFLNAGKWLSWLLWQPFRVGSAALPVDIAGTLLGWLGAFVFLAAMVAWLRRFDWIWLAVAIYAGGLSVMWPTVNARYLVPLLPLLILGVWEGLVALGRIRQAHVAPRVARGLGAAFIGSIILCNLVLFCIEATIQHSRDFYAEYEGGINQSLISADEYLATLHNVRPRAIGVSTLYINLNRIHSNPYGPRVTVLLTDCVVTPVDPKQSVDPALALSPKSRNRDKEGFREQAINMLRKTARQHVRYYLYQPPVNPWRIWHFRVSVGLQEWLMRGVPHEKMSATQSAWQLWELSTKAPPRRIDVPQVRMVIDRVPGL
jgi:hypothetical protein